MIEVLAGPLNTNPRTNLEKTEIPNVSIRKIKTKSIRASGASRKIVIMMEIGGQRLLRSHLNRLSIRSLSQRKQRQIMSPKGKSTLRSRKYIKLSKK